MFKTKYGSDHDSFPHPQFSAAIILLLFCASFLCFSFPMLNTAVACGPTTHNECVEQGYDSLDRENYPEIAQLLRSFPGAADAGAVFPDWGYGMAFVLQDDSYRDYSYTAHDYTVPSFRDEYINYVSANIIPPYTQEELKTVAFLFGSICHQESDWTWHDNFVPVGSIEDETNELVIEGGCDMFVNWENGERQDDIKWFCPVGAVMDIYAGVGSEISESDLVKGIILLSVGIEAEKALGGVGYYLLAMSLLPWTHDNFISYPAGGLEDCGDKTAAGWEDAWNRLMGRSNGRGWGFLPAFEPVEHSNSITPLLMLLGKTLVDEEAVRPIWSYDAGDGILYVEGIEIVDHFLLENLFLDFIHYLNGDR